MDLAYQLTEMVAADNSPLWVGVEERAVQLGYPVHLVSQTRSQLGRWVASAGLELQKVDHYCNGKVCKVNQYPVTPQLDDEIRDFYRIK